MAINRVYKFKDIDEASLFLNGAIFGKSARGPYTGTFGISGLVGKKLKFALPTAVEITFTAGGGPDPQTLRLSDIKSQIEGGVAGTLVRTFDGNLVIMEATPNLGTQLIAATSNDARGALGFDADHTVTGKVYKPVAISVTPPCWIWSDTTNEGTNVIYTWE